MSKILLALQYWEGDYARAVGLLKLFIETLPDNNDHADLVIYNRFDAEKMPRDIVDAMKVKFAKVYEVTSTTRLTGWPNGCNAMWSNLAMDCYRRKNGAIYSEWGEYKACLSIESDCCPMADDWLEVLIKEWKSSMVAVIGAWCPNNEQHNTEEDQIGHINGNMLFDMNLVKMCPNIMGTPGGKAWDTYHAPAFRSAGWKRSPHFLNWYYNGEMTQEQWMEQKSYGAVFIHGVKGDSARNLYLANR